MHMRVITYSTPGGAKISLTPGQVDILKAAGTWPRVNGSEYCQVSRGEHIATGDFTSAELALIIEDGGDVTRAAEASYRRQNPSDARQMDEMARR